MSYIRNKTPCKYFQQGRCVKGDRCNFAHVYSNSSSNNGNKQPTLTKSTEEKYQDLTNDRNWDRYSKEIELDMDDVKSFAWYPNGSSYGLAAPCPVNVISGRDLSSDESRFQQWQAMKTGTINQYEIEVNARKKDMEKCVTFVKTEARKAARYVQLSTRNFRTNGTLPSKPFVEHALDLSGQSYSSNSFGNSTHSSFNKSSPFVQQNAAPIRQQTSNHFAQATPLPAFGQTALGSNISSSGSSFGQSSFGSGGAQQNQFASTSNSAFGKPAFGSSAFDSSSTKMTSPFALGAPKSVFGQGLSNIGNSAFNTADNIQTGDGSKGSGSNPFDKSPFGNVSSSSKIAGHSAFGQPAFGQSAFGKPVTGQPETSQTAFGQSTFGQSTFGQPAFGQSAFGKPMTGQPAFGQPAFGQSNPSNTTQLTFGQNTFGQSSLAKASPFASAIAQPQTNTAFGSINTQASPFGQSGSQNQVTANSTPPASSDAAIAFQNSAVQQFSNTSQQFGTNSIPQFSSSTVGGNHNGTPSTAVFFVQGLVDKQSEISCSDISMSTVQLFKQERFELGNVPDIPPPLELIV